MPTPNPAALEFLLSRRSRPAKTLTTPVPSREALLPLLSLSDLSKTKMKKKYNHKLQTYLLRYAGW